MTKLTNEQNGQLIRKIGDNSFEITDPVVFGVWITIEKDFITQEENYNKTVERNRNNGKKGGRPKKPTETQNNPMGFSETQVVSDNTQENQVGLFDTKKNPQNLKEERIKNKEEVKVKDINNLSNKLTSDLSSGEFEIFNLLKSKFMDEGLDEDESVQLSKSLLNMNSLEYCKELLGI
jgi:signal transduction protein with GAF and PtsI domain